MKEKNLRLLKSTAWFLTKLTVISIPLYLTVLLGYSLQPLQDLWALVLSGSLQIFGYEAVFEGNMVAVKSLDTIYQIEVSWDSTGWKSLYAMAALVFASGAGTLRRKLTFLSYALPLVFFVNWVRLTTTVSASIELGFENFDFIHTFLWGSLMIAFVVWAWYWLFFRKER